MDPRKFRATENNIFKDYCSPIKNIVNSHATQPDKKIERGIDAARANDLDFRL